MSTITTTLVPPHSPITADMRAAGISGPGWYFIDEAGGYRGPYACADDAVLGHDELIDAMLTCDACDSSILNPPCERCEMHDYRHTCDESQPSVLLGPQGE